MATDIKELYPAKSVTLVHSRKNVLNKFHTRFHDLVEERAKELGIELVLGSRVKVPAQGFPTDGSTFDVELQDGRKIPADFAVSVPCGTNCWMLADQTNADHMHRTSSAIGSHQGTVTGLRRFQWLRQSHEDAADQRSQIPECLRPRGYCRYWRP
jgi:hypothetical protein